MPLVLVNTKSAAAVDSGTLSANSPYRGDLTHGQAAAGIAAARRNATRLVQDARLLVACGGWPTAFMLAVLAIEEVGKEVIIRQLVTMPPALRRRAWKAYADHRSKNILASFPEFHRKGARTLDDFDPMINRDAAHTERVDSLKQAATYTDAVGTGTWSEPDAVIGADTAREMVENATKRVAAMRGVSAEELRIWQKHMAPAVLRGPAEARSAVIAAYHEMATLGLIPGDLAAQMEEFVRESRAVPES